MLFTCIVTRTVHLENANLLDTASLINTLKRFISHRGPVRQIRRDQGSNFVGARRDLKESMTELNKGQIKEELLKNGCDWVTLNMNIPALSHMGGSWEHHIHTVHSVLAATLEKTADITFVNVKPSLTAIH